MQGHYMPLSAGRLLENNHGDASQHVCLQGDTSRALASLSKVTLLIFSEDFDVDA